MKISTPPGCRLRRRSLGQTPPPGGPTDASDVWVTPHAHASPLSPRHRPPPGRPRQKLEGQPRLPHSLFSTDTSLVSKRPRGWNPAGRCFVQGLASALPLTTGSILPPAPTSATSTSQPQACRPRRGPRPSLRPQPAPLPRTSDPRAGARPRAGVKLSEAFERQPAACKGTGPAPKRGLPPVPVCPVLPWTAPDGSTRCEQTGRLRCRL